MSASYDSAHKQNA